MKTPTAQSDRAREAWRRCLAAAFRTTVACAVVGGATLYGPPIITRYVSFPAFSYVTVVLIITTASTLGEAVQGCSHALCATAQGVAPAVLSLWLIGPARLTAGTTSATVAASAFVVVLPERTHLVAKRIALGQIVIVYVIAFIKGAEAEPVMHPLGVAASTALGVLACVVALLLPYPILACGEVKENCKLFAENASKRLELFVTAFCAEDSASAQALISQAKLLATRGAKYLQIIKSKQKIMKWERLPIRIFGPNCRNPGDKLQELEASLRGMEMALTSSPLPMSAQMLNQELRDSMLSLEKQIGQTLKEANLSSDSSTVPESNSEEHVMELPQTLQTVPQTQKDLLSFFFLFSFELLLHKKSVLDTLSTNSSAEVTPTTSGKHEGNWFVRWIWATWDVSASNKRLVPAFKCSLSLGLAVLFGLIYSKADGYWAGLPVAISLAGAREATFKVANVKAQGTVLGTVYGVLGWFVFEKFVPLRFLSLLPWFIFTNFLRQSRMYGQAGGVSAVIGAVLILGRRNFGSPSEFAIARIVETFIGLSCSIMVEIVLQPRRAASLARLQLSQTLKMVQYCVGSITLGSGKANLEESQKKLKSHANELKKFIQEAEVEPNFWFFPFHSACYFKLLGSLSTMVDLLLFCARAIGFLEQELRRIDAKEAVDMLDADLDQFKKVVCSSMKCLEEVTLVKSLAMLEKEFEKNNLSSDLELGKSPRTVGTCVDEGDEEKITNSFLQHSIGVIENVSCVDGENEVKVKLALSLSALGFCMGRLVRETQEVEKGIRELMQWQNPSSHINLHEISCKLHSLYKQ
ncbi:hypothetical protein NMG60_11033987 [Bertholletia excelsa]